MHHAYSFFSDKFQNELVMGYVRACILFTAPVRTCCTSPFNFALVGYRCSEGSYAHSDAAAACMGMVADPTSCLCPRLVLSG